MTADDCSFCQGDLCCFDGPCEFRAAGWGCTATEFDLMTDEEREAMREISAGVQKIFEDAVNRNPLIATPKQKEVIGD